ncbi:hypothetical protein HPB50_005430 [Hyalomma asiaticum]|uniref:Uncharacterized protein n=1 Tax=Hyalomma asiaticum TaxID=266040 RepID=A0ACB7S4P3_HYAAI|nr:hypothetical protein HPB50_005430 [Hyalomma asiaticum]
MLLASEPAKDPEASPGDHRRLLVSWPAWEDWSKLTSRRSLNTGFFIKVARALRDAEMAISDQLNAIYGRLKANNDELREINDESESDIADKMFEQECGIIGEYDDNATSILSELLSK